MRYHVRHVSRIRYAAPVTQAQFNLRLLPSAWAGQTVASRALTIEPAPDQRAESYGPYWVNTTQLGFNAPLEKLHVTSEFTVDVTPPLDPGTGPLVDAVRSQALAMRDLADLAPAPYLYASRIAASHPAISAWSAEHLPEADAIVPAASTLMSAIHREFTYASGSTTTNTPPHEAFAARKGVCQDFAHVMIMGLRAFGIPAAYVSGYLRTLPPPVSRSWWGLMRCTPGSMYGAARLWAGWALTQPMIASRAATTSRLRWGVTMPMSLRSTAPSSAARRKR